MTVSYKTTHPLAKPLCERLKRWRSEVGLETNPHLQEWLEDALKNAKRAEVEPDLVIFAIAICEWWFRICLPDKNDIRQILMHRLNDSRYTPYPRFPTDVLSTSGVPPALNQYVDRYLAKSWEPDASEVMNRVFRERALERIEKLVQELADPFLVSEFRKLLPRRGGYPDWGPWVAATVVYRSAVLKSPTEQDPKPLLSAEAVIGALRGKFPDKSAFHRKKREITNKAPKLVQTIIQAHKRAAESIVQDKTIEPLIDEDCFPSLMRSGGWSLLGEQLHAPLNLLPVQ